MKLSGKSFLGIGILMPCCLFISLFGNLVLSPHAGNVCAAGSSIDATDGPFPAQEQSPKYQFRAVWIATVTNIDWPSAPGLPVDQQKQEYLHLLDAVESMNMNAVIVQIKPMADSFYPSKYGPWSQWLTGVQGKDPGYNPLAFMIQETHKRLCPGSEAVTAPVMYDDVQPFRTVIP